MLTVLASAKPSKIHGVGLFADEFIPKGTVTWRFNPTFDIFFTKDEVEKLPEPQKRLIKFFAYFSADRQVYIYSIDDSRFLNHSNHPNNDCPLLPGDTELCNIANCDIQIGEELTVDYRSFDDIDKESRSSYLQGS